MARGCMGTRGAASTLRPRVSRTLSFHIAVLIPSSTPAGWRSSRSSNSPSANAARGSSGGTDRNFTSGARLRSTFVRFHTGAGSPVSALGVEPWFVPRFVPARRSSRFFSRLNGPQKPVSEPKQPPRRGTRKPLGARASRGFESHSRRTRGGPGPPRAPFEQEGPTGQADPSLPSSICCMNLTAAYF